MITRDITDIGGIGDLGEGAFSSTWRSRSGDYNVIIFIFGCVDIASGVQIVFQLSSTATAATAAAADFKHV